MNRKAKGSLVHGIINVILPIVVVLIHQGIFRTSNADNDWNFFIVGILLALVPIISSVIGIIVASVRLKKTSEKAVRAEFDLEPSVIGIIGTDAQLQKSSEKAIKTGLALSIIGLAAQIVFRFVLKL